MATSVAQIALGVALGLTLFCGGGVVLSAAVCGRAIQGASREMRAAEMKRKRPTRTEQVAIVNARATEAKPAIGTTGLAVPIENWLRTRQGYLPHTDTVDADELFWDDRRGWCQAASFDDGKTTSAAIFSVRGNSVRIEWEKHEGEPEREVPAPGATSPSAR